MQEGKCTVGRRRKDLRVRSANMRVNNFLQFQNAGAKYFLSSFKLICTAPAFFLRLLITSITTTVLSSVYHPLKNV